MKDDETLLEFKQRVVAAFKQIGFDISIGELSWIVDGGNDS